VSNLQSGLPGPGAAVEAAARFSAKPATATSPLVSWLGLAGFIVGMVLIYWLPLSRVGVILVILACTGLPMLTVDIVFLKAHRRPSTGLDWDRPRDISLQRSAIKVLGLAATLAVLGLGYWLFPEYRNSQYAIVFDFFAVTWPYVTLATLIYIVVIDAHMKEPRDGYWLMGSLVLGRFDTFDRNLFAQYCAGWLMKAFFVPFIISVFMANIDQTFSSGLMNGRIGFREFYEFCYPLSFALDTAFGTLGYLLTIRLADAHLRSTDLTLFGWFVALICYPPFWPFLYDHFLPYDAHAVFWGPWFKPMPPIQWLWGSVLIVSFFVFAWATIVFGCRFSNLTHRGIITAGPYRWCKHPAYVSKVLSYWLITLPFISTTGAADAIRGCLMLALLSLIYYLRARTEERHLSRDPTYVAYAQWMNEHGLLRWLGRAVPILRYRAPEQMNHG
jgi:protein-S-isoprenylcysteine O-methyltransferase Ste14